MRLYAVELLAEIGDVPSQVTARGAYGWPHGALLRPARQRTGAHSDRVCGLGGAGELVCHGSIVSRPPDRFSAFGVDGEYGYSGSYGEFDSLMYDTNKAGRPPHENRT